MKLEDEKIFAFLSFLFGIVACAKSDKLPAIRFDSISKIDPKYEIPHDSIVERAEIIRLTFNNSQLIGKNMKGYLNRQVLFFTKKK